jgi:hypothetical protein
MVIVQSRAMLTNTPGKINTDEEHRNIVAYQPVHRQTPLQFHDMRAIIKKVKATQAKVSLLVVRHRP